MISVRDTTDGLEIVEALPAGQRVIFALIALFPLLAPYELIVVLRWHDYLNVYFLFVLLICAGALFVSGFFIWAAVAGLNFRLQVNLAQRMLRYTVTAPILRRRTNEYSFAAVKTVTIDKHEWSDGEPSYSLDIEIHDAERLRCGSSWLIDEVEKAKARLEASLFNSQR